MDLSVTVRRGWSGATSEISQRLTLNTSPAADTMHFGCELAVNDLTLPSCGWCRTCLAPTQIAPCQLVPNWLTFVVCSSSDLAGGADFSHFQL